VANKYSLLKNYEWWGTFWLEGQTNTVFSGKLIYSPISGITLEFIIDSNKYENAFIKNYNHIFGVINNLQKVSLFNCYLPSIKTISTKNNLLKIDIYAKELLIGCSHISSNTQFLYSKVEYKFMKYFIVGGNESELKEVDTLDFKLQEDMKFDIKSNKQDNYICQFYNLNQPTSTYKQLMQAIRYSKMGFSLLTYTNFYIDKIYFKTEDNTDLFCFNTINLLTSEYNTAKNYNEYYYEMHSPLNLSQTINETIMKIGYNNQKEFDVLERFTQNLVKRCIQQFFDFIIKEYNNSNSLTHHLYTEVFTSRHSNIILYTRSRFYLAYSFLEKETRDKQNNYQQNKKESTKQTLDILFKEYLTAELIEVFIAILTKQYIDKKYSISLKDILQTKSHEGIFPIIKSLRDEIAHKNNNIKDRAKKLSQQYNQLIPLEKENKPQYFEEYFKYWISNQVILDNLNKIISMLLLKILYYKSQEDKNTAQEETIVNEFINHMIHRLLKDDFVTTDNSFDIIQNHVNESIKNQNLS